MHAARGAKNASVALRNHVEVPIFAVRVNISVGIHRRHVDAPLKSIGVIGNAAHRSVGVAVATLSVGALEPPLDVHIGVELSDVVRTIGQELADRIVEVAIEAGLVVIVFNDDGVSSIVLPSAWR